MIVLGRHSLAPRARSVSVPDLPRADPMLSAGRTHCSSPLLTAQEPTRPWAAVLPLLPLFLLLFSLRRLEQRTVLLGTARFFSGLSEGGGAFPRRLTASRVLARSRSSPRPAPPWGRLPPRRSADPDVAWLVVVDRSPSMYLEVAADRLGRDSMRPSSRRARSSRGRAFPPPGSDTSTARPPGRRSAPHERSRRRLPRRSSTGRPGPSPSRAAGERSIVKAFSGSRTARRPTLLRGRVGRERRSGRSRTGRRGPEGALLWDGPGTEPRSVPARRPRVRRRPARPRSGLVRSGVGGRARRHARRGSRGGHGTRRRGSRTRPEA